MGITYTVAAQTPQYSIDSINALQNTPIPIHTLNNRTEVLGNMATLTPAVMPVVINHHNGAPVFDIYANTQDSDLGSVAAKVNRIVKEESKKRFRYLLLSRTIIPTALSRTLLSTEADLAHRRRGTSISGECIDAKLKLQGPNCSLVSGRKGRPESVLYRK